MARIVSWFEKGISLRSFLLLFPLIFLVKLRISQATEDFALMFYSSEDFYSMSRSLAEQLQEKGVVYTYLWSFVSVPTKEELLFRLIPLLLALSLVRYFCIQTTVIGMLLVAVVVAYTSVIFGTLHGPGHFLVQGVTGLYYSAIFLKASGYGVHCIYGYGATTALHSSWNTVDRIFPWVT